MLGNIRKKIRQGIHIPFFNLRLTLERDNAPPQHTATHRAILNQARMLLEQIPELKAFDHPCLDQDQHYAEQFLAFLHDYIPLVRDCAREAQRRRVLHRLRRAVKDESFRERLDREILFSILRSGIADDRAWGMANQLEKSGEDEDLLQLLRRNITEHDRHFECRLPYSEFVYHRRDRIYDLREKSLLLYFQSHGGLLQGKSVLHFAPEQALEEWMRPMAPQLNMNYRTVDPFRSGVDLREDLSALSLPDHSVDLIICHHILDLIPDDLRAMRELLRVLRPGGLLQASCHESRHNEQVTNWMIKDDSLHGYIRQYGRDLPARLAQAGFNVTLERQFLDMTLEEHERQGTMPLRLYHCLKPGQSAAVNA